MAPILQSFIGAAIIVILITLKMLIGEPNDHS